ncbi:MAG: 50S ribosomal protein L4 [Nitrospirae bacterium]|nr:50S ribosomal protein L4 [Nitrospirota bacterium]
MAEIDIKDKNNASVGKLTLPESVFSVSAKQGTVHDSIVNYLANQRQGTHATKTKGLVSGGGKKPYKQKHTGRARAGSSRSPLWKGGGTVFGPQPRDYSYSLPKKAKKAALYGALSAKYTDGEITVIDGISFEKPRTKDMVALLKSLGLDGKTTLIVIPEKSESVLFSARNIPGVTVRRVSDLNTYEVAVHNRLLITKQAIDMLAEAGKK